MTSLAMMGHVTAYQVPQLTLYMIFAFLLGLSVVFVSQSLTADEKRTDDE